MQTIYAVGLMLFFWKILIQRRAFNVIQRTPYEKALHLPQFDVIHIPVEECLAKQNRPNSN